MNLRRTRGILDVVRHNAPQVLSRSKAMDQGLTNNAGLFTNPNPPVPVFANQIALTDKAQVVALHGGKGAAAARDVQLGILLGMMDSELVVIQAVADAGNPDNAVATLLAGGVVVAGVGVHGKAILEVTQAVAGGPVVLMANAKALLAAAGASYHRKHFFSWESTLDGKTFNGLPSTPEATTIVTGLAALTTVGFRVAVTVSKTAMGPWSQVVYLLVR
jgi:hypothetical protein